MNPLLYQKQIGNVLISASIAGFLWIYGPLILLHFSPSSVTKASIEEYKDGIVIPRIAAEAPVVYNVDPWNSSEYLKALEHGVAHAKDTALPGEVGTSYLFAHSTIPLWQMTHTNTPFLLLGNLKKGDEIYITRNSIVYSYEVTTIAEVWPNEIEYLTKNQEGADLILQTCTPLGTALKRLLVFAHRLNS